MIRKSRSKLMNRLSGIDTADSPPDRLAVPDVEPNGAIPGSRVGCVDLGLVGNPELRAAEGVRLGEGEASQRA